MLSDSAVLWPVFQMNVSFTSWDLANAVKTHIHGPVRPKRFNNPKNTANNERSVILGTPVLLWAHITSILIKPEEFIIIKFCTLTSCQKLKSSHRMLLFSSLELFQTFPTPCIFNWMKCFLVHALEEKVPNDDHQVHLTKLHWCFPLGPPEGLGVSDFWS